MKKTVDQKSYGASDFNSLKQKLQKETGRRLKSESELKESRLHYDELLAHSRLMQEQMRHLSHQILLAQEEERKLISRELHDEISQILTGINVRLTALKIEASAHTGTLKRKIATTQRLVEKSVAVVHRFARKLRPTMLDDLGIVPALIAFMKEFGKRTGLQIKFSSVTADKLKNLDSLKRTVLYRVAQEALTNISKHAKASLAKVSLSLDGENVCLEISDDGTAFDVKRELSSRRHKRLGILGMRERVEMTGGSFAIESSAGKGTIVRAIIQMDVETV